MKLYKTKKGIVIQKDEYWTAKFYPSYFIFTPAKNQLAN